MRPRYRFIAALAIAVWMTSVRTGSAQQAPSNEPPPWESGGTVVSVPAESSAGGNAESAPPEGGGTVATAPLASEERDREASEHFKRGVGFFREGAYRASLAEFQRAYELSPDYRLHYNIAQNYRLLQDDVHAMRAYERYLGEGETGIAAARRTEVEDLLKALRARIGYLAVQVNVQGADVFVDDERIGASPLDAMVPVNVGSHRVYARMASGAWNQRIVQVAAGDQLEVQLQLSQRDQPEPGAELTPMRPRRESSLARQRAATALWGVAGAAAATAITLGVLAHNRQQDLDGELALRPPAAQADAERVEQLRSSARSLAIATDAVAGVAIAAAATGTVLWLVDRRARRAGRAGPRLALGVGLGSASLSGRF